MFSSQMREAEACDRRKVANDLVNLNHRHLTANVTQRCTEEGRSIKVNDAHNIDQPFLPSPIAAARAAGEKQQAKHTAHNVKVNYFGD